MEDLANVKEKSYHSVVGAAHGLPWLMKQGKNAEFREIHEYYRTRKENSLKKMQSVVAVACKIIRVFYTILTKGVGYDANKLIGDIRRTQIQTA